VGDRKCAFDGCNALEFRTSGYCLRHKDSLPNEKTHNFEKERENGQSYKYDPSLIPKIALGYVPSIIFLLFLTSFSDNAFAGYDIFIYSGMCLLVLLPIYSLYLIRLTWQQFTNQTLTLGIVTFYFLSFIVPFLWLIFFVTFSGSPA